MGKNVNLTNLLFSSLTNLLLEREFLFVLFEKFCFDADSCVNGKLNTIFMHYISFGITQYRFITLWLGALDEEGLQAILILND